MKKGFNLYIIAWAILLVMFNVIVFAVPAGTAEMTKFGGAFWSGYVLIMLTFVGQLICAGLAFKAENKERLFLNLPLITISYSALIAAIVIGTVYMAVPDMPNWLGVIVSVLLLGFNAIAIVKATAAAEIVAGVESRVKAKTQFIRMITVDAETLFNDTKNEELKAMAKEVYEKLRYSDPMSVAELVEIEDKIEKQFAEFANAVKSEDTELAKTYYDELLLQINIRNKKCKLLK